MYNYGTKLVSREDVRPGQLIKFKGKTWTASANTANALYVRSAFEMTRICEKDVELIITKASDVI